MHVHVLIRESAPGKTEVLGVVLDPVDLANLMYDPGVMPADCQLTERDAVLGADGQYYWAELGSMVVAPVFSLAAHETTVAEDDAYIASLTPARRERHHPGHLSETEKKALRAALRVARVSDEMLKKQNDSNAEALEAALEAIAAASDAAAARAAVVQVVQESAVAARRAKRAEKDKP